MHGYPTSHDYDSYGSDGYDSTSPERLERREAWGSPGSDNDYYEEEEGDEEALDAEAEDWLSRVVGTAQETLSP